MTAPRSPCSSPRALPCVPRVSRGSATAKRSEGKRHNAVVICLARRRRNFTLGMLATRRPTNQAIHVHIGGVDTRSLDRYTSQSLY